MTLYESLLPAIEERLDNFYLKLEVISQVMTQIQAAEAEQQAAIAEAQQLVKALGVAEPAFA